MNGGGVGDLTATRRDEFLQHADVSAFPEELSSLRASGRKRKDFFLLFLNDPLRGSALGVGPAAGGPSPRRRAACGERVPGVDPTAPPRHLGRLHRGEQRLRGCASPRSQFRVGRQSAPPIAGRPHPAYALGHREAVVPAGRGAQAQVEAALILRAIDRSTSPDIGSQPDIGSWPAVWPAGHWRLQRVRQCAGVLAAIAQLEAALILRAINRSTPPVY